MKNVASSAVKGIGFDATCSLAVVDVDGNPLSISPTGRNRSSHCIYTTYSFISTCRHVVTCLASSLYHSV
jgi:ribulose kinase